MTELGSRNPARAGPPAAAARPRRPAWVRWLIGIALAFAGLFTALLLALQSPRVATSAVSAVLARIHVLPRSTLRVAEVRGSWVRSLELRGIRMARGDTLLAAVDTLRVRYRPSALLLGTIDVRELTLDGVVVTADIVDTTRTKPP